jgi:trimeric autotransporter adhesin
MKKIFTSILSIVLLNCGHTLLAQTITTPSGTPLSVTSNIEVSGDVNIPTTNSFKINGVSVMSFKSANFSVGPFAGNTAITGTNNSFMGPYAGLSNTTGSYNLFLGTLAGAYNTTGSFNLYMGNDAGGNMNGPSNTFIGSNAGQGVLGSSTGDNNVFIGTNAGKSITTGSRNVFIGSLAGQDFSTPANSNSTGSDNTYIGFQSKAGVAGLNNATAIGANSLASASNTVVLGQAATTITGQGLAAGASGLRFANLNSTSAATAVGGSKVLTVDASGNVILATLNAGTLNSVGSNGPVAESTWKNQDGYLYNNSTNGVVINGSGLEGNALIVKGGVLSKEVNVKIDGSDSWPDYVFKPNYKRMTLEEVERFININGHLPNVPSATEMAQTGNNLGKTDIKLLEKVEELTLYLLEMKKANDAQSAEIQSLKNQMSKLKKSRK